MLTELNGTPQHPQILWNKGKVIGQKRPLKLQEVWAIRIRLQLAQYIRELALFNLAIDSKLRGCDLVGLHVSDIAHGHTVMHRAIVLQQKTQRPVQFEITEQTREALTTWIAHAKRKDDQFLFPSRKHASPHLSTFHPAVGTCCRALGNFHRVGSVRLWHAYHAPNQGHIDLQAHQESPRHATSAGALQAGEHRPSPGLEVDDALDMAEQTEV